VLEPLHTTKKCLITLKSHNYACPILYRSVSLEPKLSALLRVYVVVCQSSVWLTLPIIFSSFIHSFIHSFNLYWWRLI